MEDLKTRLKFGLIQTIFNTRLYIQRSSYFSPTTQPDGLRYHKDRPHLYPSRIFRPVDIPKSQKVPLVIQMHGGGFVLNNPSADDPLCRYLADSCKCLVVSIDYSKSPQYRFPAAYEDVIKTTLALIEDPELPVDRSHVVLLGSSAGGTCTMTTPQDARLRGKISASLALYPCASIITTCEEKVSTRPDPTVPDFLQPFYDKALSLYLGKQAVDVNDPRLSPDCFSEREALPRDVFVITAEHDMLRHDAEVMADKLARAQGSEKRVTETGWQAGSVKYDVVKGQTHAFDVMAVEKKDEAMLAARDATYLAMANWLSNLFHAGDAKMQNVKARL